MIAILKCSPVSRSGKENSARAARLLFRRTRNTGKKRWRLTPQSPRMKPPRFTARKPAEIFRTSPRRLPQRLAWGASISADEIAVFARGTCVSASAPTRNCANSIFSSRRAPRCTSLPSAPIIQSRGAAILRYTTPMSLVGAPVVTLPSTTGAGVQLIAPRNSDARLLASAKAWPTGWRSATPRWAPLTLPL